MSRLSAIFDANWLPAILVKEARQIVRSRLVVWVLMLEMLGFAALTATVLYKSYWPADSSSLLGSGSEQLEVVSSVLLTALALVAFDGLLRTAREHDDRHGEMMLASGLAPWQILWGKMLSGWTLAALVLSAGLPFLQLAYMMRGVSVLMLGAVVLDLLAYAFLSVALAQALAKLSLPGFIRRLGGLALLLWGAMAIGTPLRSFIRSGGGFPADAVLAGFCFLVGIVSLVLAWFFFAPPRPRRTRLTRLVLLALGVGSIALFHDPGDHGLVGVLGTLLCGGAMYILALECPEFLPGKETRGGRFYPWSDGVANGVFLGGAMIGASCFIFGFINSGGGSSFSVSLLLTLVRLVSLLGAVLGLATGTGWLLARLVASRLQRRPPPLVMAAGVTLLQIVGLFVLGSAGAFKSIEESYLVETMYGVLGLVLLVGMLLAPRIKDVAGASPEDGGTESPAVPPLESQPETWKRRFFAEDWLLRPLARWENVNPVFLKEIRQLWRSRAATWLLWLCGGTIIYYLIFIIVGWGRDFSWERRWLGLAYWLTQAVSLTVAATQFYRSLEEKSSLDLLGITRLTPGQVFRGKLFSSVAIGLAAGVPPILFFYGLWSLFPLDAIPFGQLVLTLVQLSMACCCATAIALAVAWIPMADFYKRYLLGPGALAALVFVPKLHKFVPGLELLVFFLVGIAASYAAVRWYRRSGAVS